MFDLAHGYHNLEVHPEDQHKTAVILPEDLGLPNRHFEFTRLSFGLSAAPGAFQYVADRLVAPAQNPNPQNDLGDTVSAYIDDVSIGGDDFESMMQKLEAFFNRIRASGFLIKAKKCEIFQKEISYLGHVLSEDGIKTDDNKINKILHWAQPQDQKEVRSWLGLVNYYIKYVPNMATVAAPLYNLLKNKVVFKWTPECETAFQKIKQALTSPPILGTPDITKGPFTLTCDASLTGLGAVLTQEQDGKDITLAYWSKALNTAQRNYCATHRELLALVESVKAFNHYLAGAPFIVKSDHAALQWLRSFRNPTGMLARWLEKLAPHKFQVVHVKGTSIGHADALSRRPNRPCNKDCKKCVRIEEKENAAVNYVSEIELNQKYEVPKITKVDSNKDFRLIHIEGCIFDSPVSLPIVHAVSQDGKFGAGLAKDINLHFQVKDEFQLLVKQCPDVIPIARANRLIINVVTKLRYFQKPKPAVVRESLLLLRQWMERKGWKECCLPEFSCGLDGLNYKI